MGCDKVVYRENVEVVYEENVEVVYEENEVVYEGRKAVFQTAYEVVAWCVEGVQGEDKLK